MIAQPEEDLSTPIVYIVDDDKGMLFYLVTLLESANFRVRTYVSAKTFLAEYSPQQAGCLISDMMMPEMSGLDLQNILLQRNIFLPVLFISAHGSISMVKTALCKGAVDFLEKPLNAIELIESIQAAIKQDTQLRSQHKEIEITQTRLAGLTPREQEILTNLMAGESNKQIAKSRNISLRTVENHRNNILHKMRVNNFSELLRVLLSMPAN